MTVLLSLSIHAQELKSLTLKDAIVYALENKADAKARLQIEKGEYEIKEVFKSFATNCCK
jgi:hypothetical protein